MSGFGLPVLEAMAAGCPVITANRTATQEVAGGAALLVDPLDEAADEAALFDAMARLLGNPSLRASLAALGRQRAGSMTWPSVAAATVAAYRSAIEHRR